MATARDVEATYLSRFDSINDKMRFLEKALKAGDYQAAMAFADSIKDGVRAEAMLAPALSSAKSTEDPLSQWSPVAALPGPWRDWARGWHLFQAWTVTETAGITRDGEPVEVEISVPADRCRSVAREIRVARVDVAEDGATLRRVVCQVLDETRSRGDAPARRSRVTWLVDVEAGGSVTFLLLADNPGAELPADQTDLVVRGEGHALEIATSHHVARLSAQMGQLERLTYRGGHGLELHAGGEGHGEPPNIDWAHDYLAAGRFQKFRVTNWEAPPNVEVTRGPIVTIVRRWGFPHGPLHPMMPAARMLVDVSYRFYSGTPYFLKDGRMEATTAFSLDYLRDDEWVFSGYSFDRQLWIDEDGNVHEGAPPPDHADHMWGVGFFHGTSRDAFVSLRLVHAVEPGPDGPAASTPPKLRHADAPTLHYPGHGQLWSRWALRDNPALRPGDRLVQRNAYLTQPYDPSTGASDVQRWMRRFRSPLTVAPVEAAHLDAGGTVVGLVPHRASGQLARPGEGPECQARKKELWDSLRDVRDDMFYTVNASIGSMGYVHDIRLPHGMASGDVEMRFGMPHRGRPMYRYLAEPVCARMRLIAGVDRVTVTPQWDPPWTPDRMDDDAWAAFGFPVPEA